MSPMVVAIEIRYVLSVLWLTSYLHIICRASLAIGDNLSCELKDLGDALAGEEDGCCEKCFQPDPRIIPPEVTEDYFTAVFNTERIDM